MHTYMLAAGCRLSIYDSIDVCDRSMIGFPTWSVPIDFFSLGLATVAPTVYEGDSSSSHVSHKICQLVSAW
jgi:hypothetical protein